MRRKICRYVWQSLNHVNEGFAGRGLGDGVWTHAIMSELCRAGQTLGYDVCTSSVTRANSGEWLFDQVARQPLSLPRSPGRKSLRPSYSSRIIQTGPRLLLTGGCAPPPHPARGPRYLDKAGAVKHAPLRSILTPETLAIRPRSSFFPPFLLLFFVMPPRWVARGRTEYRTVTSVEPEGRRMSGGDDTVGNILGGLWRRPEWIAIIRSLAARTCVFLAILFPLPVESKTNALFTPVDEPPPPSMASDELTVRSRLVTMDLEQVQNAQAAATSPGQPAQTRDPAVRTDKDSSAPVPGTTLVFNLFDDVIVTGVVERTALTFSGGYSVAGHLVEEPLGTMTLVVNGETVAGTVRLLGETYQIRSVGEGLYAISEVEEPPLDCGVEGPHAETDHRH